MGWRFDLGALQRSSHSAFARMFKNVAWGLGSRGFNSIASVAYLAVAARALGPEPFGQFVLILTYGQMIVNFVQFQSWKGVIRYGALHVAAERQDRLERLFGFTATLDFGSALAGALLAIIGIPLVGPLFDWSADQQLSAALFASILLLTTGATPTGILRLFDRFDLVAYAEAVGPLVRLVGSIAAWIRGAGIPTFLAIWAIAAGLQALTQWVAAVVINRSRLSFGWLPLKQAVAENERVWKFMLQTNISNSVGMFWMQFGTLAVGAVSGAAEAGAFRLAQRLSKGMARPVRPVTLALYPELTRLVAADDHTMLRTIVVKVTTVAAAFAFLFVVGTGLFGREILNIIAGKEYEFAYTFLFLLSIATALELAGFALEPVQDAHGRSWIVLRAKLVAAVAYAVLLAVLLPWMGAEGAAIAAIICSLAIFVQLALATARILGRPRRATIIDAENPTEPSGTP